MKNSIVLTFDVEDWFQVENFKGYIEFSAWSSFELRVEKSTLTILDLLDTFPFKPKATFFVLGWIAKKLPNLVREISHRGHEVASHGDDHHLCTALNENDLLNDLTGSKKSLEDITGQAVHGYRAPSFSLSDSVLGFIKQAGYLYDSSYNSFSGHGRYGTIDLSTADKIGGIYKFSNGFFEFPISNLDIGKKIFPFGGGGYFRLYPFSLFKLGMKSILKRDKVFTFYAHPWEFDPFQPRVEKASAGFKVRHYINLDKTQARLKRLIQSFPDHHFTTCREYITSL